VDVRVGKKREKKKEVGHRDRDTRYEGTGWTGVRGYRGTRVQGYEGTGVRGYGGTRVQEYRNCSLFAVRYLLAGGALPAIRSGHRSLTRLATRGCCSVDTVVEQASR
jgi:hypothetical protein